MKEFKLLILAISSIFISTIARAQYVTIPNGGFANYLQYTYPGSMSGNMLDTTFVSITQATILNIPLSYNVSNLDGIQYFDNLEILTVNYHPLTSIPYLPQDLIELNAAFCDLTNITNFPASLEKIEISANNLSSLPALPSGLIEYIRAQMPTLPVETSLPSTLEIYNVSQCNVLNLPTLPSSLLNLGIGGNYGINIPILPAGLQTLGIDNLNLTSFPPIPNSLTYLWALSNNFSSLTAFPPNLEILYLNNCSNLTSVENLPSSLQQFYAPGCNISYIDFIPNSVFVLDLNSNSLTSLPNIPLSGSMINLQSNNLTTLPPLPAIIYELFLSNNQLTCIPNLPTTISAINLDNNNFSCLPIILPAMSATFQSYPLCELNDPINNPLGCTGAQGIEGYTFQDLNSNCVFEASDNSMKNVKVKVNDNSGNFVSMASTYTNGRYFFPLNNGLYNVEIDTINKPYTLDCIYPGLDSNVILSAAEPLITGVNFGLTCKPGFDVGVQAVTPIGIVFPGQPHTLNTIVGDISNFYNLNCADGISGSVTISVLGPVQFLNPSVGSLTPTISGNEYVYTISDFGSISPNSDFRLDFQTDTTATVGDQICVTVNVTPLAGDNQPGNNSYQMCYEVINSYDPNNKVVHPTNISPNFDDYLTYTINFQNTGNAPAYNIRLEDTLSAFIDLSSFEIIDYSHDMHYHLSNNKLAVYFPNIMLLDSTTSEPESKGHVTYKVKLLPGIANGNSVENTAHIFFDFNSAISTNTAITTVSETNLSTENLGLKAISVYPNPSDGMVRVASSSKIEKLEVLDQQGRIVNFSCNQDFSMLDLTELKSGVYFVRITLAENQEIHLNRVVKL